jgi:hypothetical protein
MNNVNASSDWLVMLYLSGDNDLFEFARAIVNECKRVGSSRSVKVVAEHHPVNPALETERGVFDDGQWKSTRLGFKAGTPHDVVDFVQSAKRDYPAQFRALVFFDHGNGWQNLHVFEPVQDAAQNLKNMSEVLTHAGTDVLCFDSCLMAMLEIVYELKGRVAYIVASENVIPADIGWPYESILTTLRARPVVTPRDVAVAIVNAFGGSYNGLAEPVTLTAIEVDTDKVDKAVKAIDALARELIAACAHDKCEEVEIARQYAQSFANPDYVDIISFCFELQNRVSNKNIAQRAYEVIEAVNPLVIAFTRSGMPSIRGAHGLSIYYPTRPVSDQYDDLEFAKPSNCMWSSFIRLMAPPALDPVKLDMNAPRHDDGCRCDA